MVDNKLIKSFVAMEDIQSTKKGDIITLRRYQAMVPLAESELYYDNNSTGHTFSKQWLVDNMWSKVKPHEMFKSLKEKFDHLT